MVLASTLREFGRSNLKSRLRKRGQLDVSYKPGEQEDEHPAGVTQIRRLTIVRGWLHLYQKSQEC